MDNSTLSIGCFSFSLFTYSRIYPTRLVKRFTGQLILLTVVLCAITGQVGYYHPDLIVQPDIWFVILFYFVISWFAHFFLLRAKSVTHRLVTFVGFQVIRIVLSLVFVALFLFDNTDFRITFIFNFFITYFSYTTFEIAALITNLRRHLKSE